MVTRSQALAKRKADEEVAGSPSKSFKSTPSDGGGGVRERHRDAVATIGATVRPTEDGEDDRRNEDIAASNRPANGLGNAQADKALFNDGEARTGPATETCDQEGKKREKRAEEVRDHPFTLEFAQQLQLVVERRRALATSATTPVQALEQMDAIIRLCDLASLEDIYLNHDLTFLRGGCWNAVWDLKAQLQHLH